ncbi:hypothetical protein AB0L06_39840 [Spirillospora sp. NPDC052269]
MQPHASSPLPRPPAADPSQHLTNLQLGAFAAEGGPVSEPPTAQEAHLRSCTECRSALAEHVGPSRLAANWSKIENVLDEPSRGLFERSAVRLGVPEHIARPAVASPALRRSWLAGATLILLLAAIAARLTHGSGGSSLFLAAAPLVSLAGVAVSYGPAFDPTYELTITAPVNGFRLLLFRTLAVLVTSTAIAGLSSLVLPEQGPAMFGWLLPSLALDLAALGLSTRVEPVRAGWITGAGWIVCVLLTARPATDSSLVLSPAGQSAAAAVAGCAAVLLVLRRPAFEHAHDFREPRPHRRTIRFP